jgi:hypothetical protein
MKTFTADELSLIIKKHHAWLNDEEGGELADLSYANLRYADLRYAASIWGTVGNMSQIKSVQCDIWPVTYTATNIQVGCQFHLLSEWWAFDTKEIEKMNSHASAWWAIWKPILKAIIEVSPAIPFEEKPKDL